MAFNKYYQDELTYLRQMGAEYARAYPETARFLAEGSSDPDVERMLEGFAFIAGRLRQKLDDELPELTHSLIESFWPHYLQPIPSMAIVQFQPTRAGDKEYRRIPRGTALDSAPVDGTRCRFHTSYDVALAPMQITAVTLRSVVPASISVRCKLSEGMKVSQLRVQRLRLYCSGTRSVASALHACLTRHCTGAIASSGDRSVGLGRDAVTAVGFAADETVLGSPGASFAGFALLQEYFAFPEKFLFVDVNGLDALAQLGDAGEFTLEFQLAHTPADMPQIGPDHLLAGCTPAVNLFAHDADPILVAAERVEYKVLPAGGRPEHYEVSAIASVEGLVQGQTQPKTYLPLYHQQRTGDAGGSYLVRRRPAAIGTGSDHHLTVTGAVADETLSLRLTCTNRRLPHALGPGDLAHPTDECPSGVRFRNLAKPTLPIVPPLNENLEWRLLGHLQLNYRTLADVTALRSLLDLYDLRAQVDQQARQAHRRLVEGLVSVASTTATIISGGAPMRGVEVEVVLDDDHFDGEGDMHLFASLLDELFAQYVGLNSFCRLVVRGSISGDIHRRAPRIGRKRLL